MTNWLSRILNGDGGKKKGTNPEPPQPRQTPPGKSPDWAVGGVILDDYLIEKEIGRGGMGRVWLVRSKSTGRLFAVKQALIQDESHGKAFLRELQTWIDLPDHPNIVPCRFFRTVGNEIVIFADFIEGGSLAEWIAKRKLKSLEQILDVSIQFAWGLHAIHERGLIHQDVKPGNVLMTTAGVPMVTDFGLARARKRGSDGSIVSPELELGQQSLLVSTGGMTPAYASPEQRAGQPLSRKTDIWSWGVSVLDMFMGCVSCPHGGHIAAEVLESYIENGQEEDGLPHLPEAVTDILIKCFARDVTARWPDLEQAGRAMIRCYEQVSGRPYPRSRPVENIIFRDVLRYDRLTADGATWPDPREWLAEALKHAGRDSAKATTLPTSRPESSRAQAIADLALYKEAQELFMSLISQGHKELTCRCALLSFDKGQIHAYLDDAPGAIASYRETVRLLKVSPAIASDGQLRLLLAQSYQNLALTLRDAHDPERALPFNDQAVTIINSLSQHAAEGRLQDQLAYAYHDKALTLHELGRREAALICYDKTIALCGVEGSMRGSSLLPKAFLNKANVLVEFCRYQTAVGLYDRAIAFLEHEGGSSLTSNQTSSLATAFENRGNALKCSGLLPEALVSYQRSVAIYEELVDQQGLHGYRSHLAGSYTNAANVCRQLGDVERSIELGSKAIKIREKLVEQEGRLDLANDLARCYVNTALALCSGGKISDGADLCAKAVSLRERLVLQLGQRQHLDALASSYVHLALPFTHSLLGTMLTISQREPFTHELQLCITMPHQLMTRRRIGCTA